MFSAHRSRKIHMTELRFSEARNDVRPCLHVDAPYPWQHVRAPHMVHNPPRASRNRHHLNSPIGDARATRLRVTPQKDRWPAGSEASLNILKNGGAGLSAERQEYSYPALRTCRSNVSTGLYQRQGTRAGWCARPRTPLQLSPTPI